MKSIGKDKYDTLAFGTILGFLTPTIAFFIYYFVRYSGMYFPAFVHYLYEGGTFVAIISLCTVPNLLVFFVFIWTNRDRAARGVLMATIAFALYVCVMKLLEG